MPNWFVFAATVGTIILFALAGCYLAAWLCGWRIIWVRRVGSKWSRKKAQNFYDGLREIGREDNDE